MSRAFCLLSGGLDSTVALAIAIRDHNKNCEAISVNYGQRHLKELDAAVAVSREYGIKHTILPITDMPASMLTDPGSRIPNSSYADLPPGVSPTYVPFRNGQLLAKIAARASVHSADNGEDCVIYAGMHAEDAERDAYPDCTMHFLGAMAAAIYIGTYHKVRLNVPLVSMYKKDIVATGNYLRAPLYLTWSCYAGGEKHCGICPTCRARWMAFIDSGLNDPTAYKDESAKSAYEDHGPF